MAERSALGGISLTASHKFYKRQPASGE